MQKRWQQLSCINSCFFLLKAPDEAQNTEGLFTVLNEFWVTELADILLPRDQVSLGDPLYRGMFLVVLIVFY